MTNSVICKAESCRFNDQAGGCNRRWIEISDDECRADGFWPRCKDYEESEDEE